MKFVVQRTNAMPLSSLFSTLFVWWKNFFLYLVVVDERSSANDCNHSSSPPSKRYRKQCKEVLQKSLIQSSPTDGDESARRSGVRRSDLGLLTFSDSSPNIAYNIHSRDHRMGKLNKLNMDPFELSSSDREWTELNVWRHCISTPQIFMKNWGLLSIKKLFSLHLGFCFVWFFHNVFVIMCALNIHRYV